MRIATLASALASTSRVLGFLTVGVLLGTFVHFCYFPCRHGDNEKLLMVCLGVIVVGVAAGTTALVLRADANPEQARRAKTGLRLCLIAPVLAFFAGSFYLASVRIHCSDRANESVAVASIRSVISAQVAYASANAGYYDLLSCLPRPWDCLPGYETAAPGFLDDVTASTSVRRGYIFTFHPGPAAAPKATTSKSSLTAWAYVAVPEKPGETGHSGYCGDSTGRVCFTRDGSAPLVVDGSCRNCETLR
jgi:hypothetical protein